MGLRFAENIMYYLVVSFAIVYLKSVHKYDTSSLLLALLIAHVIHFAIIPQYGRLADRIEKDYRTMLPFVRWLNNSLGYPAAERR